VSTTEAHTEVKEILEPYVLPDLADLSVRSGGTMMKRLFAYTVLSLLLLAGAANAQPAASAGGDTRWLPWIGCWQLLDESVQDESDVSAEEVAAGLAAQPRRATGGTRVCVARAEGGVTMTTLIDNQPALAETILADAANHPIADGDCRGSKRSEWSKSGTRLYTTAEISCADQTPRKVSSLTMIAGGPTWVDVQLIDVSGRKNIRIRKFQRTAEQTAQGRTPTVPFVGETSWTLDDIKEASSKLAPETVQAALVELRSGFNLTGKQLIGLDEAGVPDSVIDLMIALSYPQHFVVEHPVNASAPPYGYRYGGLAGSWPWIADAAFWPSYYSPFAYRYWGYYDPFYVPNSGYVYIGQPGLGGGTAPVASGDGRVVDGRGYTRVTTRESEPSIRANNFGGGTNSTMSSGGSSSSGSSSGGASSGGGYSSGGGSSDTGRTAVPRPPGGN
jgi:uncharacterized membrane protein YgcG